MPPATQPAVTRDSPILLGCRMLDGQVHCDNDPRDGGVRAGRVAYERAVGLSLSQASLFESEELLKPTHSVGKSILRSL